MENGTKVQYVKEYVCGYCVNNEKNMYEKAEGKEVQFPARVLLVKHRRYGYILIDTGYSEKIHENGIKSKVYNRMNPTFIKAEERIDAQLKKDNIQPRDIQHIILTHLHPDHIGGLYAFPNAKLHASGLAKKSFRSTNPFKVVFKNMISKKEIMRISPVEERSERKNHLIGKSFDKMYDLFGDESICIVPLPGHGEEHIGVLISEHDLFFIADASWNKDDLQKDLKFMPRRIQNSYKQYQTTKKKLIAIKEKMPQLELIASHDPVTQGKEQRGRTWGRS